MIPNKTYVTNNPDHRFDFMTVVRAGCGPRRACEKPRWAPTLLRQWAIGKWRAAVTTGIERPLRARKLGSYGIVPLGHRPVAPNLAYRPCPTWAVRYLVGHDIPDSAGRPWDGHAVEG